MRLVVVSRYRKEAEREAANLREENKDPAHDPILEELLKREQSHREEMDLRQQHANEAMKRIQSEKELRRAQINTMNMLKKDQDDLVQIQDKIRMHKHQVALGNMPRLVSCQAHSF